jgi:peptide/nickel transport system permease protein
MILPSLTLGLALTAILVRMIRSSLLEELQSDYIRTARAKGCSEPRVFRIHALRNAMLPVLTILGLQFGSLLTGAIITETIFSWPGIGRLLIQAIYSRDYPLVQGCILVFAALYAVVNFMVDLLYGALDPRIQLK